MSSESGHRPVMPEIVVETLAGSGSLLLDCTVGLAGHALRLMSELSPQTRLIALDVDDGNLALAQDRLAPFADRVSLHPSNFADARGVLDKLGIEGVDMLLADLGISSSQLDDPQRGLSFNADGPLDMRLDPRLTQTAADLVAELPQDELADLIYACGDERYSRRIASAIVAARKTERIDRTRQLADIVTRAYPRATHGSRRGVHPATRTFQALRIAVNDELSRLDALLAQLPGLLNVGGRACIISFHSLEDRRVKQAFAAMARQGIATLLTKKPRVPGAEEIARNPRSRSAKLRGLQRTE